MKLIKILFIVATFFILSCYSTQNSGNTSDAKKTAVVNTTAGASEEKVSIYGLIKADKENVFIVTNWRSKSMVTYAVSGFKKAELAKGAGKYASVSGVLTNKQTWSGMIDVKEIISIDDSPDPKKEKRLHFMNKNSGR